MNIFDVKVKYKDASPDLNTVFTKDVKKIAVTNDDVLSKPTYSTAANSSSNTDSNNIKMKDATESPKEENKTTKLDTKQVLIDCAFNVAEAGLLILCTNKNKVVKNYVFNCNKSHVKNDFIETETVNGITRTLFCLNKIPKGVTKINFILTSNACLKLVSFMSIAVIDNIQHKKIVNKTISLKDDGRKSLKFLELDLTPDSKWVALLKNLRNNKNEEEIYKMYSK